MRPTVCMIGYEDKKKDPMYKTSDLFFSSYIAYAESPLSMLV